MNVSIVITMHNAESTILEALESVKTQTYPFYEVIIVDDGSTDNTRSLVQIYLSKNRLEKFKLFSCNHYGRGKSLEYAINKARFDWVAILDADDLWHPEKLSLQTNAIKKHNITFIATKAKTFTESKKIINEFTELKSSDIPVTLIKVNFKKMLLNNYVSHCSVLMKKTLAIYDQKRKSQFDYELWLRLLHNKVSLYYLSPVLAYHRLHKKQSFEGKNRFLYAMRATRLQLIYCLKSKSVIPFFLVLMKIFYYLIIGRKFKLLLSKKFG